MVTDMSEDLLQRTRNLNEVLQASAGRTLGFAALSRVLAENLGCNTWILDNGGGILGYHWTGQPPCAVMRETLRQGSAIPASCATFCATVRKTRANLRQKRGKCVFDLPRSCLWDNILTTVVPIPGAGRRQGSLVLTRAAPGVSGADLVLAENAATMAGLEIVRRSMGDQREAEHRRIVLRAAVDALSPAEREAVRRLMPALAAGPTVVVTARAARRTGCTRSVLVNALHKLKSAGVIELKSHGMKGTYVRVVNGDIIERLAR
jgi:transcriptional pleiotropic repressor